MSGPPSHSVLHYCHDSFGLGHLRRSLAVAGELAGSPVIGPQLIVTGSAFADRFSLPPEVDYVKLPCATKSGDGSYASRSLPIAFDDLRRLREEIILGAARGFRPDLVVVDHSPAGMAGEMLPTLRYLKAASPRTRLVLGLRDVVDDPVRVRRDWSLSGIGELLDDVYDRILVYGQREVHDPVRDYAMSPSAARKVRFVGYLGRPPDPVMEHTIGARDPVRPSVLVTVGGGGDGERLIDVVTEAISSGLLSADADYLIVGGPYLPAAVRTRLAAIHAARAHVRFSEFTSDLAWLIRRADAVIAMGGYNTVCEILSSTTPAVIVPRISPRLEQWVRAGSLADRGLVRTVHPDDLDAPRLASEVEALLKAGRQDRRGLALGGLARACSELADLLSLEGAAA